MLFVASITTYPPSLCVLYDEISCRRVNSARYHLAKGGAWPTWTTDRAYWINFHLLDCRRWIV
jgi:hypothetical protein